jgi:quercetin dioxygenase-like cupin family protein
VKVVRFDPTRAITEFGSRETTIAGVARCSGSTRVAIMRLSAGGLVGAHKAAGPQLFLVMEGAGWVRANGERTPIVAGEGALWEDGEWHETGSQAGLSAVVVEADSIELI